MVGNLSPSEQLTYSTVRIECEYPDGGIGTGTGFFFRFAEQQDKHVPAIVTNKHVIEGATRGKIHFNLADNQGLPLMANHVAIMIDNFQSAWIPHPIPDIDLCAMPIAPLLNQATQEGKRVFFITLDRSLIPPSSELAELTALEEIIMIGYPNGIWDALNNMPIIRKGITATHPNVDYNGKKEFMIDAACFPGSSGSPVFLFNFGTYATKSGTTVVGSRIKLLGVLYAGPQHTATGEIEIVDVPTRQRAVTISRIPNNLGLVIKSQRLLDFDTVFR